MNIVKIIQKHCSRFLHGEFAPLGILLFFIFLATRALFHNGFFRTIDDITVVRIMYMAKELQTHNWVHNFPVRLSGDLARTYSYPLYLFYGPLVYYVGGLLLMTGKVSHIVATKWVYVFPLIIGPLICYWSVRQRFTKWIALVVAVVFCLYPYRGYDTYIRGGVGEAWAMAFMPAIFGGLFLMKKKSMIGGIILSLSLGLTVISHNISGLLIVAFVLFFILIFYRSNIWAWIHVLIGLGISAFFWLPALVYLPIVKVNYSNQNTGQVLQFLEPITKLVHFTFPYYPDDKNSILLILWIIVGLFVFFLSRKHISSAHKKEFAFWSGITILFFCLMTTATTILWQLTLPLTRLLQFPWRIFIILAFIQPFFVGYYLSLITHKKVQVILSVIIVLSSLYFISAFKPREYSYYYEYNAEDTGLCAATWGDEYIPVWVQRCHGDMPKEAIIFTDKSIFSPEQIKPLRILGTVDVQTDTDMIISKYYFPGWTTLIDGKIVPVDYTFSPNGVFQTRISQGKHQILVEYRKTTIMWIADGISAVALLLCLASGTYALISRSKKEIKKKKQH